MHSIEDTTLESITILKCFFLHVFCINTGILFVVLLYDTLKIATKNDRNMLVKKIICSSASLLLCNCWFVNDRIPE
jgi:hypothetical protein